MRFLKIGNGKLEPVANREQAHEVIMTIEELEALERKLQNKIEEAERWRKRVTGEDMAWKITRRIYSSTHFPYNWTLFLSIPLPHSPELFRSAQEIASRYFDSYMDRGYTLQYTAGAGWVLSLRVSNDEYETFTLPR